MFDALTPLQAMDDGQFDRAVARLRADLLDAQYSILEQARTPVILLIAGVAGAGRGVVVNTLNEWMDPRHIRTSAFGPRDEAERLRPHMWRFWQALPSRGRTAIVFEAWFSETIRDRVDRRIKRPAFDRTLQSIRRFEHMLAMEDAVVLKFWLHLDADTQRARFKALEKDAATRWRVTPEDWHEHRHHRRLCKVAEKAIRETDDPHAPWHLIDARDTRLCELAVGRIVLRALRVALAGRPARPAPLLLPSMAVAEAPAAPVSEAVGATRPMTKALYQPALEALQGRLNLLLRQPAFDARSLVLVFEGMDAAGKGGRSAASPMHSMRASTVFIRLRRHPNTNASTHGCGVSGVTCRATAGRRCSTARGTAGCWSNGWKALPSRRTGRAPTTKSTPSSRNGSHMAR